MKRIELFKFEGSSEEESLREVKEKKKSDLEDEVEELEMRKIEQMDFRN